MDKMPDVWDMIFTQTPSVLRWALGVLIMGIFTLASFLFRRHQDDIKAIRERLDKLEMRIQAQNVETNRLLFQIARNTNRAEEES
ncbi:hypothetical protein [Halomonas korlensis]|uniref:Uncharacterized protein n=1 Tax=Halomonas korlensis TaxID=463301 RepID=A0A1I7JMJ9_9GAMM|nr:hypothetical protein [Halomonas korlensis]SFU86377.1 hypothetical protein SAMN04487955_11176 [Halomonas korlensis]